MRDEKIILDNDDTVLDFDFSTSDNHYLGTRPIIETEETVVYSGLTYASVRMIDLRIKVEMDPYPGSWDNEEWARRRAWEAIKENLTPKMWFQFAWGLGEIGRLRGRREVQREFRQLLG